MKIDAIKKFSMKDSRSLNDWVMGGEHYPKVDTYYDDKDNKSYQVSEKHSLYRETPGGTDLYEVQAYGEWKKLSQ